MFIKNWKNFFGETNITAQILKQIAYFVSCLEHSLNPSNTCLTIATHPIAGFKTHLYGKEVGFSVGLPGWI